MKYNQFRKELLSYGVEIVKATGHDKLYYQGHKSLLKRHPTQEISNEYRKLILRQLGLR